MTGLSKLHNKCKKCKHKDNCDNKRMVACGYLHPIMPAGLISESINDLCVFSKREYIVPLDTVMEEVKKQLERGPIKLG